MLRFEIDVSIREKTGKGIARKLRAEGMIPAIIFGPRSQPLPLALEAHAFKKMLIKAKEERILFTLNIKNRGISEKKLALIKEFQLHPVNDSIWHVDFYEVSLDRELHIDVPVKLVGKAKGVEKDKGVLEIKRRSLKVSCLPDNIPNEIQVDVTNLGLGEAIHVSDVSPPVGVKIIDPSRLTIVTVVGLNEKQVIEDEQVIEDDV